jgi:dipeptidyl aminopeptidase/acylaminoacyl peptidase
MIVQTLDNQTRQVGFYRVDLENGSLARVLEESKNYGADVFSIDVASNGKRVVYLAEDAQHSMDVWAAGENFENPRCLTHINPVFDNYSLGASRLIEYRDVESRPLRAALLLPSDYQEGKPYPLVVVVYGGSNGSNAVNSFGLYGRGVDNCQLLATRGYAVLYADTPLRVGSPMLDLAKTVLPAVNKAIELGIADPNRIGVMGDSYGGYSTLALIVQSTRFKAAVSSAGFGDLIGQYGKMRADGSAVGIDWSEQGQGRMGGTPWQFRDRYLENSPVFFLNRVETPLLIIQGGLDQTVPPFLSDQIFVNLRRLGKEVVYAKYAQEDHDPSGWSYADQVDYMNRVIAWFDEHLKKPEK